MKAEYYNTITPQVKEAVGFPLNHVDLTLDQDSFIESVYDSMALQLKKEEISELIQELHNLTREDIEDLADIEEMNRLVEEL